jgi:hypothetical protein
MTVITKPLSGVAEKKKEGEEKLVVPELVQVDLGEESVPDGSDLRLEYLSHRGYQYLSDRAGRVGKATHTCLVLTVMLASVMGLLAGVHIYRNLFLTGNYRGMCRIPLNRGIRPEDTLVAANFENHQKLIGEASSLDNMFALFNQGPQNSPEKIQFKETLEEPGFEFDFELDLEMNDFETLELPEIFSGRYMHDFKVNYTAIIDPMGGFCFILPLDRTVISPPRNIFDIFTKMRDGTFDVDYEEIRQDFRVGFPIESFEGYGSFIPRACSDKRTYRLEHITNPILKRDTSAVEGKEKYGEYTGKFLVRYNILNLKDVTK